MSTKLAEQIRLAMMFVFGSLLVSGGASMEDLTALVSDLGNLLTVFGAIGAAGTSLWAWKKGEVPNAKDQ